jgi:hypothetical protein
MSEVVNEDPAEQQPRIKMEAASSSSDIEVDEDSESKQEVGEETLPRYESKLGFSIAQIMGFMGKSSSSATAAAPEAKEDDEKIVEDEATIGKSESPSTTASALEFATSFGGTRMMASQAPPPKLWRPQPFRDFVGSGPPVAAPPNTGYVKS